MVSARNTKRRVDELENRILEQDERITRLSNQLAQLKKEGVAPPPVDSSAGRRAASRRRSSCCHRWRHRQPLSRLPSRRRLRRRSRSCPRRRRAPAQARVEGPRPPQLESPPVPPPPRRPAPPIEPPEPPPPPARSFDWEQLVGVTAVLRHRRHRAGVCRGVLPALLARQRLAAAAGARGHRRHRRDRAARRLRSQGGAQVSAATANAMDAAAIAILFATFFAAHSLWNLISGPVAFGLLALVTLDGGAARRSGATRCSSRCSACSAASRRRSCCRPARTGRSRCSRTCCCSTSGSRGSRTAAAGPSSAR